MTAQFNNSGAAQRRPALVERRHLLPFALIACLFATWTFAASLNDVLIRHFQHALDISRTQSSFIQIAFYVGYFCAAIPAGLVIRRLGYKAGILAGLTLYALGAFLFYPAASLQAFPAFLGALYLIAFGLAFLETSANPYVAILGPSATGAARLNLAQGFAGLGAITGPAVGGLFIISGVERSPADLAAMAPAARAAYRATEAASVQMPYVTLGSAIVLLGLLIAMTRFPEVENAKRNLPQGGALHVLRHTRLRWAVVAQFFYVGAQVGIWSFFIDFTKDALPHTPERQAAFWLSASIALLMAGRFLGAFLQRFVKPARLLGACAAANIVLCLIAAGSAGGPAVAALWLSSLFMSIMFPSIFAMGVEGLGNETEMGSSLLVMAIVGGAFIPPGMGLISEHWASLHAAMLVPAACFAVCLTFAVLLPEAGRVENEPA
ncbi:L-fucose:H+ symporter permease [Novosphingobium sp. SG707]|uniref:L-fucose:H+ symporter permease n=1 Tax=Novosphingobium sp. SG707 TaxID=2586996 RepID=UPI001445CF16|nr:L-fucose:H+ symporter permease [Novosphingobium sp. SG707]NKJ02933.1 FHS family L-fucose permease-like MFS transporter [Novosphingobium sp. SG707]